MILIKTKALILQLKMLDIINNTRNNTMLFLGLSLCLFSCQKSQDIKVFIYKKGSKNREVNGSFYYTKYGGLNYYIFDENESAELFKTQNIDSVILVMNNCNYTATPLKSKAFSREISTSDFSFFISGKEHKIVVDTINGMKTMLLFSAKKNIEEMKDKKLVKFTLMEE